MTKLNIDLITRPWSCHVPIVAGYEPTIKGKVERVNRRKKNAWRCSVLVNGEPMFIGHSDTKAAAESRCAKMVSAYTDAHYRSR